jgi:hypothetical protein
MKKKHYSSWKLWLYMIGAVSLAFVLESIIDWVQGDLEGARAIITFTTALVILVSTGMIIGFRKIIIALKHQFGI